jgi:hypothetical protein
VPSLLFRKRIPRALLCLILSVSCGPNDMPPPDPADLGGPDRLVTVDRTPVWTIGGIDAPTWAAFGEVTDIAFDGDGNLHVLDGSAGQVTVIDVLGELVRSYGAPGQGPGEISAPGPLVVHADGSASLYDYGHLTWLHFDTVGAFVHLDRAGENGTETPGSEALPHPDGSIIAPSAGVVESGAGYAIPVFRYRHDAVGVEEREAAPESGVGIPAAGEVLFEAWALPPPPPPGVDQVTLGGSTIAVRIPRERGFEPGLHLAILSDGRIAVADSFDWHIELRAGTGRQVGVLERPIEPLPVTDVLREGERARRLAAVARGELPSFMLSGSDGSTSPADRNSVRRFMEARLENMVFTDHVPVIAGLDVDSRGTLWVARNSNDPGVAGPTDLVSNEGAYLGTLTPGEVRLPRTFGPDGLAAWVTPDELGVFRIRVDRLSAPR